jgi:hypothetical protein
VKSQIPSGAVLRLFTATEAAWKSMWGCPADQTAIRTRCRRPDRSAGQCPPTRLSDRASHRRLPCVGKLHSDGSLSRTVSLVAAKRCRSARSRAVPSFDTAGSVGAREWPALPRTSLLTVEHVLAHYVTTSERSDGASTTAALWSGTIAICCDATHVQDNALRFARCILRPFGNSI